MSSKRKSSATNYNFRLQNDFQKRGEGTKPLPNPVSVGEALLTMFLHLCRKVIFVNTNIRILSYLAILFISVVFDTFPFPRSYFSQSSNILNQYFVKLGWAWTLVVTVPFVLLTSFTYCCGNRRMVGWHLARIGIATVMWFVFTKSFVLLESSIGQCSVKGEKFASKQSCLSAGFFWHSLDISGHAFILIYSSLVIIEEARAIVGWDTIQDLIRNEDHHRNINETDLSSPLKNITKNELGILKLSFKTFTPYVRGIFIAQTLLVVLWDVMILSTALYFHSMIEKLPSGILAISVWWSTYKIWFSNQKLLPYAPGQGIFQYNQKPLKTCSNGASPRTPTQKTKPDIGPTFMGMPIYSRSGGDQQDDDGSVLAKVASSKTSVGPSTPRPGPVTRSQTFTRADIDK